MKKAKKINTAKKQNTIVFDIGGVLLDWNPRHLYRKLFDDENEMEVFLRNICSSEWNSKLESGSRFSEEIKKLVDIYPEYAELIAAYDYRYEEFVSGSINSTVNLLERLYLNGSELHILSNWSAEKFFFLIKKQFSFFNYFKSITLSSEVGLLKPDERIFHLLLSRINKEAKDCLFIDDNEANIESAKKLGFSVVHFKNAEDLELHLVYHGFNL